MKIAANFVVSIAAFSALVTAAASHAATDLAELPLKAAVLAKPNVIFGMDNSGSMDWEFLLDTFQGLAWWSGTTMWSSGKPLNKSSLSAYAYLFPVGTDTGGQTYAYNNAYGRALPPTPAFAWLRSASFNPLYYDPAETYRPWAPAYHDGALNTYSNADPTAALAHPAFSSGPSLALNQPWDSSNADFKTNGYTFYFQRNMEVPSNAAKTSGTCTPGSTVTGSNTCYAAVPYYPATYWHAEDCGTTSTAMNADCVLAPDGVTKLKRYEIKSGNTFPSGRSYADEMKNFANWFTYYRKRKLMLAASMGEVLENLTGLRIGVVPFNSPPSTTKMHDIDDPTPSDNGLAVAGLFYKNGMSTGSTPTHDTMKTIANRFDATGNQAVVQYACQRNSMFIVTDGFASNATSTVPSYSKATYGSGAPYATTPTGGLSDLALAYYTRQLRSDLVAGRVPPSTSTAPNADKNPDLHINTYAISLGARGSIWPEPFPNTKDPFTDAPAWPSLVAEDPAMIDDLYHATLNGRGQMYLASSPQVTAQSIRDGLNDILDQVGAQGGVAVSTVNLQRGDSRAYFGTYNPAGWSGDLTANPISPATGQVSATPVWSAGDTLLARPWGSRVIASYDGSTGVSFSVGAVGAIVNPGGAWGDDAEVIDYLRGDRTHEGTKFRARTSLLGAVINAEPVVARDDSVAYFASGEGMLHAIDTSTAGAGQELWAFVPRAVLANIGQTSARGYTFKTRLDGTPVIGKTGAGSKLLVAGMGVAGRSYYAIDVSSPRGLTEAQLAAAVKWEFPAAGDATTQAKVGQTAGRPAIVRLADGTYTVLVTSGYNNGDGIGRLWMLDPATGTIQHEFSVGTSAMSPESGLAHVTPFVESDGKVKFAYGGDLLGNLWKFDLVAKPAAATKIATLKDGSGKLQPITAAPELIYYGGHRIILVGTGRLLDIGDFGKASPTQSFYAISDGSTIANVRGGLLVAHTYNKGTDTTSTVTVDWDTKRGWYMDLPSGEQANTRPAVARGVITFVTNTAGATDCAASSRLYALDVLTGNKFDGATFVGTTIALNAMSSGVNLLLTSGSPPPPCTGPTCPPPPPPGTPPCQYIVGSGQDADGNSYDRQITQCVDITPAKNAWREVRR